MNLRTGAVFLLLCLSVSCSRNADMNAPHVVLAEKFAHAIAEGRFEEAHALLSADVQSDVSAATLKNKYDEMVSYGPGPSKHIETMQVLEAWPEKKAGDIGWVYVAIAGDSFSEGVTVVVARVGDRLAIRSIEWGRP